MNRLVQKKKRTGAMEEALRVLGIRVRTACLCDFVSPLPLSSALQGVVFVDGHFEPALDAATIYLRGFRTGNEEACDVLLKVSAACLLLYAAYITY
jgi:hypothetical protein